MFESAADFTATLEALIPGFVLMKIFYQFGLRTKRSDAQWAVWSVLVAAILNAVAQWLLAREEIPLWFSFLLAVLGGIALVVVWRALVKLRPQLVAENSIRAWDVVMSQPHWIEVLTKDGQRFLGYIANAADSVETEDLDLYIKEPKMVDPVTNTYVPVPNVEGVLLDRERIASIAVFPGAAAEA